MLIQHSSDLGLMLAALPYVERDLRDAGYSESYALLFDRLQVMQGKPQRYGTQMARLPNGEAIVLPVEDLESVDERRRSIGLPPLGVPRRRGEVPLRRQAPAALGRRGRLGGVVRGRRRLPVGRLGFRSLIRGRLRAGGGAL
jgi:hypothetical protein